MNSEYTIVVPDNNLLASLCGTNDKNLQLIEEHLGVPVWTRGNELSVENSNPEICQKFQFIVDRIIDEVQAGGNNSEDVILTVLNTEKKVDADEMVIMVLSGCNQRFLALFNRLVTARQVALGEGDSHSNP